MMMHDVERTPAEKYSIGMLAAGEPLTDSTLRPLYQLAKKMGLLEGLGPLTHLFAAFTGLKYDDAEFTFGESTFTLGLGSFFGFKTDTGYAPLFRSAIESLSDEAAKESVLVFRRFIRTIRRFIHQESIKENQPGISTNPLTMFGQRQRDVERTIRAKRFPRRITAAQMLALFFAIGAVGDQMLKSLMANAEFLSSLMHSLLLPKATTT